MSGIDTTENIKKHIPQIIRTPVSDDTHYIRPIDSLFEDPTIAERNTIKPFLSEFAEELATYFSRIHSWFPANPSCLETIERSCELFVTQRTDKIEYSDLPKRRIANHITYDLRKDPSEWEFSIENILKRNDHLFVVGRKGTGKTTFFNFWLNNRSDYLEKNLRLVWFRVDASKLYDQWVDKTNKVTPDNFSLESYHILHTLYVTLKYGKSDKCHSAGLRIARTEILKAASENNRLTTVLKNLYSAIDASDRAKYGRNTQRFIEHVLNKYHALNDAKDLYQIAISKWKEVGLQVLYILDGVDNVSWARGNTELFDLLCEESAKLFIADNNPEYVDGFKVLIVVRPETYYEIRKRASEHLNTDISDPYKKIVVVPPCPNQLVQHKAKVIEEPKSICLRKFRDTLRKEIEIICNKKKSSNEIDKMISKFVDYSDEYVEKLSKGISSRYSRVEKIIGWHKLNSTPHFSSSEFSEKSNIVSILFHDNIRAFVDNFVENYSTIMLADENKIPGARNADRMPQYLLLNGRQFLDSPNIGWRVRGEAYPNIFWWNKNWEKSIPSTWYGLVSIRSLQLLRYRPNLTGNQVVELVEAIFGYGGNILENSLDRFIKYGLIEISEDGSFAIADDCNNNDHAELVYPLKLTGKGQFYLDFIFMYTDWLYFFALDTPVARTFAEDTRHFRVHRGLDYTFIRRFNDAFISTTLSFARVINTQQEKDNRRLSSYFETEDVHDLTNEIFRNSTNLLNVFNIPDYFPHVIKEDVGGSFQRLKRSVFSKRGEESGRDLAEKLYLDLKGHYQFMNNL
ncbi:hypothetical protein [Teredinibacter turnerae]|uniref:hypothetical protein n=1 Tax=Teredinibacter turnerae TaxID=2426 RepID=UPI0004023296|nr:hypothetical protein [Teredinibacter turnerae]